MDNLEKSILEAAEIAAKKESEMQPGAEKNVQRGYISGLWDSLRILKLGGLDKYDFPLSAEYSSLVKFLKDFTNVRIEKA